MSEHENALRFEHEIAPHLDSAYNLARWLTNNDADADEILQEASLRAYRFLGNLRSKEARAWFLQIVRNESYSLLKKRRLYSELNDQPDIVDPSPGAEVDLLNSVAASELRLAIEQLPPEFREILVLRELEELDYREISEIAQIPEGTVMSRLSRARALLRKKLLHLRRRFSHHD